MLHVVESCSQANHAGITLRKYTLHSVDDDTSHALSPRAASGGLLNFVAQIVLGYYSIILLSVNKFAVAGHAFVAIGLYAEQLCGSQ